MPGIPRTPKTPPTNREPCIVPGCLRPRAISTIQRGKRYYASMCVWHYAPIVRTKDHEEFIRHDLERRLGAALTRKQRYGLSQELTEYIADLESELR